MSPAALACASATSAPAPVEPGAAVAPVDDEGAEVPLDEPEPHALTRTTTQPAATRWRRRGFMRPACPRPPEHRLTASAEGSADRGRQTGPVRHPARLTFAWPPARLPRMTDP